MSAEKRPISRKDGIVVQEHDGEILIYDLSSNKAMCLNETSALIWRACDGSKGVSELSTLVSKKMNAAANEDLIWLALDQLKKEKLIDQVPDAPGHLEGMSRRDVIRKIGLGTALALPIVAALVAPRAANAASVNCGSPCVNDASCAPAPTNSCRMCPNGGGVCGP